MEENSDDTLKNTVPDKRPPQENKGKLINRLLLIGIGALVIYLLSRSDFAEDFSVLGLGEKFYEIFLWRYTPEVLAAALLVYAIYLIITYYFFVSAPLKLEIEKVSNIVSRRTDPETFTRDFALIDDVFRETACVRDAWREFKETLHKTAHEISGKEIYHNSKRPHDYINEESISQSGREIRRLEFYPGLFVAVGLVLTFIGLLVALYHASAAITQSTEAVKTAGALAEDPEQITAALEGLIRASAFKFWTSISGIGCSILLTIISRRLVNNISEKILRLQNQLERGLIHLSAEKIQLRVEQGIRGGFSEAITEAAGNELRLFADRMDQIGEELQSAEKVVKQLGDTYQVQLKTILTAFISTTDDVAGQTKSFQKEVSENQKTFSEDLSRQHELHYSRTTDALSKNFDDAQQKLSEFQASIQVNLEESKSHLSETSREIIDASKEQLSVHASEIGISVKNVFKEAAEEFSRLKDTMDENYEASISSLRASNEEFINATKVNFKEHSAEIGESYVQLGEEISGSVRTASDEFNNSLGSRFQSLSEMTENLFSAAEKTLQDHNGLQDKSSGIIESINGVAENLAVMKDEIIGISEKNTSELKKTSEQLDAISGRMQQFSKTLETKTDADFDNLARTVGGLESSLKNLLSQTIKFTEDSRALGAGMETAVENFSAQGTEKQGELIGEMSKLSEAISAAADRLSDAKPGWNFFKKG